PGAEGHGGTYNPSQGSEGQTLADGEYYWRVGTVKFTTGTPTYANYEWLCANDCNVAFVVDTTAPDIDLDDITPNPTSSDEVVLTGVAEDEFSTVESVEYKVNSSTPGGWTDCIANDGTF